MAFWEADPIVEDKPSAKTEGDWWKSDPVIEEQNAEAPSGATLSDLMSGKYGNRIPKDVHIPTVNETGWLPAPIVEAALRYGNPLGWAQVAAEHYDPNNPIVQAGKGAIQGLSSTIAGATTPENLSLLALAPEGKLAQRLIAGTFLGQSIAGTPEQWDAFNKADNLADKFKIGTEMGLGLALPAAGLAHSFKAGEVPKVEPAQSAFPSEEIRQDVVSGRTEEAAKDNLLASRQELRPSAVQEVPQPEITPPIVEPSIKEKQDLGKPEPQAESGATGQMALPLGQPVTATVYHGTRTAEQLDPSFLGLGTGAESAKKAFFYTTDKGLAQDYADMALPREALEARRKLVDAEKGQDELRNVANFTDLAEAEQQRMSDEYARLEKVKDDAKSVIAEHQLARGRREELGGLKGDKEARVLEHQVTLQKPYVVDFKGQEFREQTYADVLDKAKKSGADGVIFKNTHDPASTYRESRPADIYAVFPKVKEVPSVLEPNETVAPLVSPKEIPQSATGEPNGPIRQRGTAQEIPSPIERGENQQVSGERVRPSEQGQEVAGTGQAPEESQTTGIAQRVHEKRGVEIEPGEGIGAEDQIKRGRNLISEGVDPNQTLAQMKASGRINADDISVLRARHEELGRVTNAAEDAMRSRPNDPVARRAYDAAWQTETNWAKEIKPFQTEWHKIGMAQQGEVDIDTGTFTGLRRAVFQEKGRDVKPHEVGPLRQVADKVQAATAAEALARKRLSDAVKQITRKSVPHTAEELRNHFANRIRKLTPC